jgi:hypothetical protein
VLRNASAAAYSAGGVANPIPQLAAEPIDSRDVDGAGVGIRTANHTTIILNAGRRSSHCDGTDLRVESDKSTPDERQTGH